MEKPGPVVKTLHRVEIPARVVLTVTTKPGAPKTDIRARVINALRKITGADGGLKILDHPAVPPAHQELRAKVYFEKKDESTVDGETIFTLRGLQHLEALDTEIDDHLWAETRL